MRTRIEIPATELRLAIAEAGWRVETVEDGGEWWYRELWHLKSTWSPQNCEAFLFFLVDPHDDSRNPKICAVQASATRPSDRLDSEGQHTLYFGKGWPRKVSQLIDYLGTLRGKESV